MAMLMPACSAIALAPCYAVMAVQPLTTCAALENLDGVFPRESGSVLSALSAVEVIFWLLDSHPWHLQYHAQYLMSKVIPLV